MRRSSVITVALALLVVGAMAACSGKKAPSAVPTVVTTLGPDPSASAEPTPTVEPSQTADPGNSPTSSIPSKIGYVWIHDSNSTYVATTAYMYNQGGGPVNVTYVGVGKYKISFGGLGSSGGVAHAQAYGSSSNYCTVDGWSNSGGAQVVTVSCFNAAGNPADSTLVVNYAVGSQGNSRFSYLWANDAGNADYQPNANYRYDPVDPAGLRITRNNTGRYEVAIPASGPLGGKAWTFQVTAYSSNAQCKLSGFSEDQRKAQVTCRTPGGVFMDSRFSLSFASATSFLGRTDRQYGNYSEDTSGLEHPETGVYRVKGAGKGTNKGQVVALARGTTGTYCHIVGWGGGADMSMTVACFNPGGAPADSDFEVSLTW